MIVRQPLREQVRARLYGRIYDGSLAPGTRVRDTTLAGELGVSRTPVREALVWLEREGVVVAEAGYGFTVRPLSATEVREKYPIVWTLEGLALRTSPPLSKARLRELRQLNKAIAVERADPIRRVELDTEWHKLLLSGCENSSLLEMIDTVKTSIRRYEIAYMLDVTPSTESIDHHNRIVAALSTGDMDSAVAWLERNWAIGVETLVGWLDAFAPEA
jgi:DNA-binding GntR family transcriptional regulator